MLTPLLYHDYILIWGTYYHKFGQNIKIVKILCTKDYMASSEAMTSSTHSFAFISTGQEMFRENLRHTV